MCIVLVQMLGVAHWLCYLKSVFFSEQQQILYLKASYFSIYLLVFYILQTCLLHFVPFSLCLALFLSWRIHVHEYEWRWILFHRFLCRPFWNKLNCWWHFVWDENFKQNMHKSWMLNGESRVRSIFTEVVLSFHILDAMVKFNRSANNKTHVCWCRVNCQEYCYAVHIKVHSVFMPLKNSPVSAALLFCFSSKFLFITCLLNRSCAKINNHLKFILYIESAPCFFSASSPDTAQQDKQKKTDAQLLNKCWMSYFRLVLLFSLLCCEVCFECGVACFFELLYSDYGENK